VSLPGRVFTWLPKETTETPSGNGSPVTVNTGTAWSTDPRYGDGLSDPGYDVEPGVREMKFHLMLVARPISKRGLREQQTADG